MVAVDHTQWRSTVSRAPLDEWSALRRDLYLTTHITHNRFPCLRARFVPAIRKTRQVADPRLRSLDHWLCLHSGDQIEELQMGRGTAGLGNMGVKQNLEIVLICTIRHSVGATDDTRRASVRTLGKRIGNVSMS
jgi:hypothetical protein